MRRVREELIAKHRRAARLDSPLAGVGKGTKATGPESEVKIVGSQVAYQIGARVGKLGSSCDKTGTAGDEVISSSMSYRPIADQIGWPMAWTMKRMAR